MEAKELVEKLQQELEDAGSNITLTPYWEMDSLSRPLTGNVGFMLTDEDGKQHQVQMPGTDHDYSN